MEPGAIARLGAMVLSLRSQERAIDGLNAAGHHPANASGRKVASFKRVLEIRRGGETKMPGFAAVAVTEPTFGEANGLLAARYGGVDSERKRRFHCL